MISQDKLEHLAANTGELVTVINESVSWVNQFLQDEDRSKTNYSLKEYRRRLNNIKNVLTKRSTVSLFGKSQVGKSYLVGSILSTATEKDLKIPNFEDNKEHSFIGELNPPGGKESTGVVSRFTIARNSKNTNHSIEVKLLSPKDLILVIYDTYYADIDQHNDNIKNADIIGFLENINSLCVATKQYNLIEDDIFDIKDYLKKYYPNKTSKFDDLKYWEILAGVIENIPYNRWNTVFEIVWGKNERFSKLFVTLIDELKNLEFANTVQVEFSALLVKYGSILDVARLFQLDNDQLQPVKVEVNGYVKQILRSRLAALTYEVVIPIKENIALEKDFLQNVDILDFPGARSRETAIESKIASMDSEAFYDFYRRGKVAYLFNRYTENYEVSSLLFCIDNEQLEVKSLPKLLNNWIDYSIGENAEKRGKALIQSANPNLYPLLIVFTKANMMIQQKPIDNDGDYDYKWETRFKTIFISEYCKSFTWYDEWAMINGRMEKFKNLFLLRSFSFPEKIYQGFDEQGKELSISPDKQDYMKGLAKSFANYKFNQEHFHNAAEAWSEFTDLNKDGSEYIIRNIKPLATNVIRTNRYVNLLNEFKENAKTELARHYHNEQADDQIIKAAKDASGIVLDMNIVFGADAFYFGKFIEHLMVSESDIFSFYHDLLLNEKMVTKKDISKYILLRTESTRLSVEKTYEENLEILREDYNHDTLAETEQSFVAKGIILNDLFFSDLHDLKNNSAILAEEARNYWFETKLNISNFEFFVEQGFEKQALNKLFANLKASFNRLELTKKISLEIKEFVDVTKKLDKAEEMVAHITAGKINEFINSVGWSYYSKADKQKIAETNKENKLNLVIPNEEEVFSSIEKISTYGDARQSVEKLIDYMDVLNENLSKIPIDKEATQHVPMLKNYERWKSFMRISFIANCDIPTYNVEANRKLGGIMDKLKEFSFSV